MTDLEITKRCAEKMELYGNEIDGWPIGHTPWDPLNDDAQAASMVKRFSLVAWGNDRKELSNDHNWHCQPSFADGSENLAHGVTWNRAICECVASLQSVTAPPPAQTEEI